MVKCIFNTAIIGLRRLGCSRHDDVVSRAFDMPEAPSNRPSMVRVSQPSATPTVPVPSTSHTSNPRRDSSLLDRSQSAHISQRHGATQVINLRTYIPPELTTITHFFPIVLGGRSFSVISIWTTILLHIRRILATIQHSGMLIFNNYLLTRDYLHAS